MLLAVVDLTRWLLDDEDDKDDDEFVVAVAALLINETGNPSAKLASL